MCKCQINDTLWGLPAVNPYSFVGDLTKSAQCTSRLSIRSSFLDPLTIADGSSSKMIATTQKRHAMLVFRKYRIKLCNTWILGPQSSRFRQARSRRVLAVCGNNSAYPAGCLFVCLCMTTLVVQRLNGSRYFGPGAAPWRNVLRRGEARWNVWLQRLQRGSGDSPSGVQGRLC